MKGHIKNVKSGKVDIISYTEETLKECEDINKEYNFFTTIDTNHTLGQAKEIAAAVENKKENPLAGIMISVKDCICVKDMESTASSTILKGYKPLFHATAIARLIDAGAIIIGKTAADEFGFGSFAKNTGPGIPVPVNPINTEHATGGSSGGCGGITKKLGDSRKAHVSLAESTGGSIVCPASFCGVIGFCPTYGAISRYGLIPYANSLDKIGLMATKVDDISPVFEVIKGFDEKDGTSLRTDIPLNIDTSKIKKIAVIKESLREGIDKEIIAQTRKVIEQLKEKGITVDEVSLPKNFKYGISSYYITATCEASTNLSCLSGLRYGVESDKKGKTFRQYFSEIRSKNFSEEAKRRILLGTFARMTGYRDAYYIRASKIRTLIIEEYKEIFKEYDVILSPTMPVVAPKFSEIEKMTPIQHYMMDILTVGPNLAGMPHGTVPSGEKEGMPIGIMGIADHCKEEKLLSFMKIVEELQ
jgi:aspartyl-tRNA(Asn)/glutamyl-tRNA(Gln) amidotransferase subunit A